MAQPITDLPEANDFLRRWVPMVGEVGRAALERDLVDVVNAAVFLAGRRAGNLAGRFGAIASRNAIFERNQEPAYHAKKEDAAPQQNPQAEGQDNR